MFNLKEYKSSFYLLNKEKYSSLSKLRYEKNKEKIKEGVKKRRLAETEEQRIVRLELYRKYRKENSEKIYLYSQLDKNKYNSYRISAKKRDYKFELTKKEFSKIFHESCNYCNKEDARGIDRVDNSLGYNKENCVACCEMCNKMKWKWSKEEFLIQIEKIYKYNKHT